MEKTLAGFPFDKVNTAVNSLLTGK
jgi:hypothetical protein